MTQSQDHSEKVGHTAGDWIACNMIHAERGDQMTPEELGEYVANAVRKTREAGGFDHFLFVSAGGDGPDICLVGNGPQGPANATLIAAAPTMLEALREALTFIADEAENRSAAGSEYSDYEREPRELAESIEAAIRLATGEAE